MSGLLRWPGHWTLRTRLTVAVLALIIPLNALAIADEARAVNERQRAAMESAGALTRSAATVLDSFATDIEGALLGVAYGLGSRESPLDQETVAPYLSAVEDRYPVLRSVFLTDLQGRVTVSNGGMVGLDLSSRPYIRALQAGANEVWAPSVSGSLTGSPVLVYARVVHVPQGPSLAYLAAAFYPNRLMDRLTPVLPQGATLTLIDQQGYLVYSSANPDATQVPNVSELPGVQRAFTGEFTPLWELAGLDGNPDRYGGLARVQRTGWVVGLSQPLEPLQTEMRNRLAFFAGTVTLVVAVAALFVAGVAYQLTRPLALLTGIADRIARDERPAIPHIWEDPEVDRLASAMRAMSQAVAEREEELRAQASLREEFLAVAAHELKTPLATLKAYVQLLSRNAGATGNEPNHIAELYQQVNRLEALVVDLLDASRIQQNRLDLHIAPVDLVKLASAVMARLEHAPERRQDHHFVLSAPGPVTGHWDEARLDQVLTNLLSNALKYSPDGGEIRIQLRAEDGFAEITVTDQGIGIPPEDQAHVFEPFVRHAAVATVSGTGLGLFISAAIVKRHGGDIRLISSPGKGTTFMVRLPNAAPVPEAVPLSTGG